MTDVEDVDSSLLTLKGVAWAIRSRPDGMTGLPYSPDSNLGIVNLFRLLK